MALQYINLNIVFATSHRFHNGKYSHSIFTQNIHFNFHIRMTLPYLIQNKILRVREQRQQFENI